MKYKALFGKIGALIMARPLGGGLEINDTGLRFVVIEGGSLRTAGVRLVPGVLVEGRIKDRKEFVKALRALRKQVLGLKAGRRALINVVVSLSSINIYTQVFKLPFIEGENLEKAVQLNIQMASPTAASEDTYAGWQTVSGQDEHDMHLEVVTAFLPRGVADELTSALRDGGFLPIALESRAISLARLIRGGVVGVEPKASLIAVSADASGLDVMIVRDGHLNFDYFNSWRDIQGNERQISLEAFRTMVVRSVNQVVNFYNAHWKDQASNILVASTGMKDEVLAAIQNNFNIEVHELTPLASPALAPEWYVSLGGALRGLTPRRKDREISLLGVGAREEFQREQVQSFLDFWRVLTPAALAVLLAAFAAGWFFLNSFEKDLAPRALSAEQQPPPPELAALRADARRFNDDVAMLRSANQNQKLKGGIFSALVEIVTRRNISIERLVLADPSQPVTLQGSAPSEEDIIAFKNELVVTSGFTEVNLPLTDIRKRNSDYSFSVKFMATP